MRRILCLFSILATIFACSKDLSEPTEVSVSIDYTLPESGNMGRSGAALYAEFYDTQIATRKLTPSTYQLTFTNIADQSTVTIKDQWNKNHALKLLAGTYKVEGTSASVEDDFEGGIDTLYLSFNEEVKIEASTTNLTLNAKYDSFMVFFDARDIKRATYHFLSSGSVKQQLSKSGDIFYLFSQGCDYKEEKILIERNSGTATIRIGEMTFEKGKYYYFGDLSSGYNLPYMENGN